MKKLLNKINKMIGTDPQERFNTYAYFVIIFFIILPLFYYGLSK
jgi:hypothetical protein